MAEEIQPKEVPIYVEFMWVATVAMITEKFSPDAIKQIANIAMERCSQFGTDDKDLKSFYKVIEGITDNMSEVENVRTDN